MEALPFDALFLAGSLAVCVVLMLIRSRLSPGGMRDFLGITTTFVVLVWLTFQMILAEHLLG
ncbi:MAG TPA: hypothetical protein VG245_01705 [Candidatus Dormibacteraeota bacterium]|nr:hypothetical protein [Candidatus Dormibacteraeota bacterium]